MLGFIYKLSCKDSSIDSIYVGSTFSIRTRTNRHKFRCLNSMTHGGNCKVYKFIRAHGGWENWQVDVIEEYECDSREALELKEEEVRLMLNATLNSKRARLTRELRKSLEQIRKAQQFHCDCGGTWTAGHGFARHSRSKIHQNYLHSSGEAVSSGSLTSHDD